MQRLKSHNGQPIFLFSWISSNDFRVSHHTGLPNKETFTSIFKLFDNEEPKYVEGWKVTRFNRTEQFFFDLGET